MADETELTAEETKFFETGGETELTEVKEEVEEQEAPEPKEETAEVEDKKQKMVPHGALHEERQKRREIQEQLNQERIKQAKLEERLTILAQSVQKKNEPQIPEFEQDPANHLKMVQEQERQRLEQIENYQRKQEQLQKEQQDFQGFMRAYETKAAEFAQQSPDFKDAYKLVLDSRISEYKTMGYSHEEAVRATVSDERMIAQNAMQRGVNPAEVIYNLAKQRGFRQQTQKDSIDTLSKGVSASKSIGNVSGRAPAGKLSLEALAGMSDEEFAEATKGDNFRKMFS